MTFLFLGDDRDTSGDTRTVAWDSSTASLDPSSTTVLTLRCTPAPEEDLVVALTSSLPSGTTLSANSITILANETEGTVTLLGSAGLVQGSGTVGIVAAPGFEVGNPSSVTVATSGASSGGGPISGDTGLGAQHRAPGASFDYVIDVSDGAYTQNAVVRGCSEFNTRIALPSNDPLYIDKTGVASIAILLPERVESKAPGINGGLNYDVYEAATLDIDDSSVEVHFIGPWIAEPTDNKVQAMIKVRDRDPSLNWGYGLRPVDEFGVSPISPGGGYTLQVNVDQSNYSGGVHFWCFDIRGCGRSCISIGTAPTYVNYANVTAESDVHFHLCQLHQDDVSFTQPANPNQDRVGNSPFWGVSGWNTRVHIHGWYSDLPWNSEHHFYLRETPYGDMVFEYFSMDRCGGQLIQFADRYTTGGAGAETLIGAGRTDPGTIYYRNATMITRCGRWTGKASAWYTNFSTHQALDFENVVTVEVATDNCHRGWPPADPLTDPIANEAFAFTNGTNAWTHDNSDRGEAQGPDAPNPGYQIGPIKMRGCLWYSKLPTKNVLDIRSSPNVDIQDCGIFTGPAGQTAWDTSGAYAPGSRSAISFGSQGRAGLPAANFLGQMTWLNNCTAAHRAVLEAAPFNIPSAEIAVPAIWIGTTSASVATADQDITFDYMDGDTYVAGVNPANLVVS